MHKTIVLFIAAAHTILLPAFGQKQEAVHVSNYEELLGKNKIELENEFIFTIIEGSGQEYPFNPEGYEKAGGRFYMKKGKGYITAQVRNDSYAEMKRGKLKPLINVFYPEESVMTLFTTPAAATGFDIELDHHKYGFVEEKFTVNLSDLLASCMEADCVPYIGIEECGKESVTASVFLVNTIYRYNHVIKVKVDISMLKNATGCISADLYTYIPSHNISDLYAK